MQQQQWQARQYSNHAAFVSELGSPVLALLAPTAGETILDLGCGDGTLALQITQCGAQVVGVDASASMVEAARAKGISADVMDAEHLPYHAQFDAVFSNAALHWMLNYDRVIAGVARALRPRGRFVGEFGGYGNIAALTSAMAEVMARHPEFGDYRSPWFFPSVEQYTRALEQGGFQVDTMALIPRPTPLKTGIRAWLTIFANHLLSRLEPHQTEIFLQEVEDLVRPQLYSAADGWVADYVRLRFSATKSR